MNVATILVVAIAAALPLSTIAARDIQRRVQPVRLELARRGEALLQRHDLPKDVRADVEFMLNTAFGMGWAALVAIPAMPIVAFLLIFSRRVRRSLSAALRSAMLPEVREIRGLHASLMLANNPILVPVAAVWTTLWVTPALAIARLIDSSVPATFDQGEVMRLVEQRALAHAA